MKYSYIYKIRHLDIFKKSISFVNFKNGVNNLFFKCLNNIQILVF